MAFLRERGDLVDPDRMTVRVLTSNRDLVPPDRVIESAEQFMSPVLLDWFYSSDPKKFFWTRDRLGDYKKLKSALRSLRFNQSDEDARIVRELLPGLNNFRGYDGQLNYWSFLRDGERPSLSDGKLPVSITLAPWWGRSAVTGEEAVRGSELRIVGETEQGLQVLKVWAMKYLFVSADRYDSVMIDRDEMPNCCLGPQFDQANWTAVSYWVTVNNLDKPLIRDHGHS